MDTTGTAHVQIRTYGLDGSTPVSVGILAIPAFQVYPDVGRTDSAGALTINLTPGTYHLSASSWDPLYYLIQTNLTITGGMTVTFRPPQMPRGQITLDIADFSGMRIYAWGTYTAWAYSFWMSDGQMMLFSPDTYNLAATLTQSGWDYSLGNYGAYQVNAGQNTTIQAGGALSAASWPFRRLYAVGETVKLHNAFTDAFGNDLVHVISNTVNAGVRGQSDEISTPILAERTDRLVTGESLTDETIAPMLQVRAPNGQLVLEQTSWGVRGDYSFSVPTSQPTGVYTNRLALDTGPHQGLISASDWFCLAACRRACVSGPGL